MLAPAIYSEKTRTYRVLIAEQEAGYREMLRMVLNTIGKELDMEFAFTEIQAEDLSTTPSLRTRYDLVLADSSYLLEDAALFSDLLLKKRYRNKMILLLSTDASRRMKALLESLEEIRHRMYMLEFFIKEQNSGKAAYGLLRPLIERYIDRR